MSEYEDQLDARKQSQFKKPMLTWFSSWFRDRGDLSMLMFLVKFTLKFTVLTLNKMINQCMFSKTVTRIYRKFGDYYNKGVLIQNVQRIRERSRIIYFLYENVQ